MPVEVKSNSLSTAWQELGRRPHGAHLPRGRGRITSASDLASLSSLARSRGSRDLNESNICSRAFLLLSWCLPVASDYYTLLISGVRLACTEPPTSTSSCHQQAQLDHHLQSAHNGQRLLCRRPAILVKTTGAFPCQLLFIKLAVCSFPSLAQPEAGSQLLV